MPPSLRGPPEFLIETCSIIFWMGAPLQNRLQKRAHLQNIICEMRLRSRIHEEFSHDVQ